MVRRRDFLAGSGATAMLAYGGRAAWASDAPTTLEAAAFDAFIYTRPLIESATARAWWMGAGGRLGQFLHMRAPTTPATQRITTPNNDTVNSSVWIDLATGPATFTLPPTGNRYVSATMMDMFSNNFAVLGSRATGPDGGTFTIVGPDMAGPPGAIRSPTRWIWILVRTLVDGAEDLPRVHALQQQYGLKAGPQPQTLPDFAKSDTPTLAYLESAGRLLRENPGPASDLGLMRRIAPLGLVDFNPTTISALDTAQIAQGIDRARSFLAERPASGVTVDGWTYPQPNLGDFKEDYLYRAQIALTAFAALPVREATYAFGRAPDGSTKFDSSARWQLHLPGNALPPNDAFWSLVMYRATPEGHFRLFDNPINRYSVGDRTQGLVRDADGGVTINMQRDPARSNVNWLPTPAEGPFGVVFRIFRPRREVLDGTWRLPAITRL